MPAQHTTPNPSNQALNEFEPAAIKPFYTCTRSGVYYVAVESDKDGNVSEKPPLRLSDAIEIIGRGVDMDGSHYRVIRWRDPITNRKQTAALSMAEIGTNQGWQILQQRGITILSGRRKREMLADYLQTDGATTPYTITEKAGWLNGSYILPSGEILAPDNTEKQPVIYNGDTSQAAAYTSTGSLEQWQQQVCRYAAGNSRLCLAIGTALAAPLLEILDEANGGFHLYCESSAGKTVSAKVALSVWGKAKEQMIQWNATPFSLQNAALARNDGLLVLDEIGEADPRTIGRVAYSVINGKSRLQGAKDGGNRHQGSWRVLVFSTGELTMKQYVERNGSGVWEAGQAVRMPSIPADTKHGIYEHLHGFKNGAALSDALMKAIAHQHGTAGRAWIDLLQRTEPATIRAARDAFLHTLPELDGQALRVAKRFALVSAALETAAPVTGLPAGVGMAGIKQCFDDWLLLNGTGKYEDSVIIEQAANFMQQFAHTARFTDWNAEPYYSDKHCGYRRDTGDDLVEYWTTTPTFEQDIGKGKDKRKVCEVLHAIGWLKKNGERWQFQIKNKGRFYVLMGAQPPEQE